MPNNIVVCLMQNTPSEYTAHMTALRHTRNMPNTQNFVRRFCGVICGRVCDGWTAAAWWRSACLVLMAQASLPGEKKSLVHGLHIGNEDETNAQIMWPGPGGGGYPNP